MINWPDEELHRILWERMQTIAIDYCNERQIVGDEIQGLLSEIQDYLSGEKPTLDVFAEILCFCDKYQSHELPDVSDQFSKVIDLWRESILTECANSGMTSLRYFVNRAQGRTPEGECIRWNPNSKRFEVVPWSLDTLRERKLPPYAVPITDSRSIDTLRKYAKESGYLICENRESINSSEFDTTHWHRTLEILDGDEPVITIWHKREKGRSRYWFVEQYSTDEMSQEIKRWVNCHHIYKQYWGSGISS